MTEFKINYIVTIERENKGQDDQLYFEKSAEVQRFLTGFTETMREDFPNEEYTITICKAKGAENGEG